MANLCFFTGVANAILPPTRLSDRCRATAHADRHDCRRPSADRLRHAVHPGPTAGRRDLRRRRALGRAGHDRDAGDPAPTGPASRGSPVSRAASLLDGDHDPRGRDDAAERGAAARSTDGRGRGAGAATRLVRRNRATSVTEDGLSSRRTSGKRDRSRHGTLVGAYGGYVFAGQLLLGAVDTGADTTSGVHLAYGGYVAAACSRTGRSASTCMGSWARASCTPTTGTTTGTGRTSAIRPEVDTPRPTTPPGTATYSSLPNQRCKLSFGSARPSACRGAWAIARHPRTVWTAPAAASACSSAASQDSPALPPPTAGVNTCGGGAARRTQGWTERE